MRYYTRLGTTVYLIKYDVGLIHKKINIVKVENLPYKIKLSHSSIMSTSVIAWIAPPC